MKQRHIFVPILILSAFIIFLASCEITTTAPTEVVMDPLTPKEEYFHFLDALSNEDIVNIQKYGKLVFECKTSERETYYSAFSEVSLQAAESNSISIDNDEQYCSENYNCFAWAYMTSYLFDENQKLIEGESEIILALFKTVFPNFKIHPDSITDCYEQVEIGTGLLPQSPKTLKLMLDYLSLYALYDEDCDIESIYKCLGREYSYLKSIGVPNTQEALEFFGQQILYINANSKVALPEHDGSGSIDNLSKKSAIATVEKLTQNNELGYNGLVELFGVAPKEIVNGKYIIRTFTDDGKIIAFYGEPVNSACIVDKQTGELLYSMLYDRDIILERAKSLKDN